MRCGIRQGDRRSSRKDGYSRSVVDHGTTFYDVICFGNRLPNVNKAHEEPEDQNTERNHWPKRQVSRSRSLGKFGGLQHHQVAGNGALLGTVLPKVLAIVGS